MAHLLSASFTSDDAVALDVCNRVLLQKTGEYNQGCLSYLSKTSIVFTAILPSEEAAEFAGRDLCDSILEEHDICGLVDVEINCEVA